jgi:hypothetical protein
MSSFNDVEAAILEKMHALAVAIEAEASGSGSAVRMAAAVNHLAEARAWLHSTEQPHGGTSSGIGD